MWPTSFLAVMVRYGSDVEAGENAPGPLADGELMTCVLCVARPHDLDSKDAFVIPAPGGAGKRPDFNRSMRGCVSARISAADRGPELPGLATQ